MTTINRESHPHLWWVLSVAEHRATQWAVPSEGTHTVPITRTLARAYENQLAGLEPGRLDAIGSGLGTSEIAQLASAYTRELEKLRLL